jgi:hypothetical protein
MSTKIYTKQTYKKTIRLKKELARAVRNRHPKKHPKTFDLVTFLASDAPTHRGGVRFFFWAAPCQAPAALEPLALAGTSGPGAGRRGKGAKTQNPRSRSLQTHKLFLARQAPVYV